jgi:predicted phosphodiesterase
VRIGLVTDIHDDVDRLTAALAVLRGEGLDALVCLGDSTDFHGPYNRAWEVAKLLHAADAVGVWGNHDFGLCRDVPLAELDEPDPDALAYFATWQPRLSLADCHFTHVEPWLNTEDVAALWYFDGPPDTAEKLARSFAAVPHHALFTGHFHSWLAGTQAGPLSWTGDGPLTFDPDCRYLVTVAPVFNGCFAVYDSDLRTLFPHRLA